MLGPSQPRLHLSACTTSAAESGVGAMIPTGLEPSSLRSSVIGRSALSAAPPALPPLPTPRTCSPWSIGAPPGSAADTDRSSESRANARGPTASPSTSVMVTANSTTTAICVRNTSLAVVHERVRESWGGGRRRNEMLAGYWDTLNAAACKSGLRGTRPLFGWSRLVPWLPPCCAHCGIPTATRSGDESIHPAYLLITSLLSGMCVLLDDPPEEGGGGR